MTTLRHGHAAHGYRRSPEYSVYCGAKSRCRNPKNNGYHRYGGRGIEFRFTSFEEFFAEVGSRPTAAHSLERIDNDGHYELGNVKWVTRKEQQRNTRSNHIWTYNGESLTVVEWADRSGLRAGLIYNRLANNIPAHLVLSPKHLGRFWRVQNAAAGKVSVGAPLHQRTGTAETLFERLPQGKTSQRLAGNAEGASGRLRERRDAATEIST